MTRFLALFLALGSAQAASLPSCFPQGGFKAGDAHAKSGRELQLKSNDVLVLAGIDIPAAIEARTKARIDEVAAQGLRYVPLLSMPDRYGRIPADLAYGAEEKFLQGALVSEGYALAMPSGIRSVCIKDLLRLEKEARQEKAGLWAQPSDIILQASDHQALNEAQGQFRVIEGTILNVGKRDYATFLNFGTVFKHDFAVIVLKKNREAIDAVTPLAGLKGRQVLVRGILRPGTPPRLTLENAESLEVLQ
ncbi:MAG: thermonuclease family protein [Pseudomonadota bacterium]